MKRYCLCAACVLLATVVVAQGLTPAIPYDKKLENKVERTLRKLTLEEKVGQMCELTIDVLTDNSRKDTAVLNEKVKEFMRAAISLDSIAKVECNSDYNFTDASTKEYRYQAVFDIKYYL